MNQVKDQYEAYPYPERDPADEKKRLIGGSPSHPLEIDHFVFAGKRDWSQPLRALVAGGGTGDGLIQLAQVMTSLNRPYDITYIDLSQAARGIAEERARVRGLTGITFVTGSLLDAADHGPFDYIDCCGVLHHLPEPQAGFDALAAALAPGGGIGLMVYAPLGRSGVYPLQQAFEALLADRAPQDRLLAAKQIFARLPEGHPFRTNPHLVDHEQSDAGFYDLLLHSQDRPFAIDELIATLDRAGLALSGLTQPALYDLTRLLPKGGTIPDGLDAPAQMALAEKLRGTIKTHVAYAVPQARAGQARARPRDLSLVPHLRGAAPAKLAQAVAAKGQIRMRQGSLQIHEPLAKSAAPLIAAIDGRRSLSQIAARAGLDPVGFQAAWAPLDRTLGDWGLLLYVQGAG